jgi:RNA polymerase sigma factor (TIGR02999 family)
MTILNTDMKPDSVESITRLLVDAQAGNGDAWSRIYSALYDELHRIARSQIRHRTLGRVSATSLVSESWLRLANAKFSVENRRHFIAMVARAMRFVLVDETRKEMAEKRAGGLLALSLDDGMDIGRDDDLAEIIGMDAALTQLEQMDARLAGLVEMRYFGGLDESEIAAALGVTDRTLRRDWRRARAFLLTQLGDQSPHAIANP